MCFSVAHSLQLRRFHVPIRYSATSLLLDYGRLGMAVRRYIVGICRRRSHHQGSVRGRPWLDMAQLGESDLPEDLSPLFGGSIGNGS